MFREPIDLFKELTPSRLAGRLPTLSVGGGAITEGPSSRRLEGRAISACGWLECNAFASPRESALLAGGIEQLRTNNLPPLLIYAFDEAWCLGLRVRDLASATLGAKYDLLADVWAFQIDPGQTGWAPHRGVYRVLDRAQPEYLNVWIALSDAGIQQSCMHFVPLDDDAAYTSANLESIEAHPEKVIAAPLAHGDALIWNANILHWGGPCASESPPRISMTFTLRRADFAGEAADPAVIDPQQINAWKRLEIIARQVRVYGALDSHVTPAINTWAEMTLQMSERLLQRST